MSDDNDSIKRVHAPRKVLRKAARKGSSGEHPIMQDVRKKLDSIREGTLSELEALNARIDKIKAKSDPPSAADDEKETTPTIPVVGEEPS
jgi:hypothetical protein